VPAGRIPTDFIDATLALARDKGMGAVADNFNTFLSSTITDEERLARGHKKVSSMDVEAFAAFATELNSYASMLEELATIACPALVLVGENDTGLRGSADAMAERIPGATLAVIAGAGHSPQEDDPDAWLAAVEAHLARVG
jgi:3-oxoadipate enol-lactonase